MGVGKSTDGGATFTVIGDPVAVCLNALLPGGAVISSFGSGRGVNHVEIDPLTSNTVYAAAFGKGIRRSTNGGSTWGQVFKPGPGAGSGRAEFGTTAPANRQTRNYGRGGPDTSAENGFLGTRDG